LGLSLDGQGKEENNDGEAHMGMVTDGPAAALTASDCVLHRYPPPVLESPKVFETKNLSLDLSLDSGQRKSPAFAGLSALLLT
jgi:hypothetical protein